MFGRCFLDGSSDPKFDFACGLRSPLTLRGADQDMLLHEFVDELLDGPIGCIWVLPIIPFDIIGELVCHFLCLELGSGSSVSRKIERSAVVVVIFNAELGDLSVMSA